MNIKKILAFCEHFQIDLDALDFYPGWKRGIHMCLTDEDWVRCVPQEESFDSDEKYEEAREAFQEEWFCFGDLEQSFNVYYG